MKYLKSFNESNFLDTILNIVKVGDIVCRQGLQNDPIEFIVLTKKPTDDDHRYWGYPIASKHNGVFSYNKGREIDFTHFDIPSSTDLKMINQRV